MFTYVSLWEKTTAHPIGKQWRYMYKIKTWNSGKTNK